MEMYRDGFHFTNSPRAEVAFAPQVFLMNQLASYLPVHVRVVAIGVCGPAFPKSDESACEDASKSGPHP